MFLIKSVWFKKKSIFKIRISCNIDNARVKLMTYIYVWGSTMKLWVLEICYNTWHFYCRFWPFNRELILENGLLLWLKNSLEGWWSISMVYIILTFLLLHMFFILKNVHSSIIYSDYSKWALSNGIVQEFIIC